MTGRLKTGAICFMAYLVCACLLTWPLPRHLKTHLPLGTESAATVPLFNLWTLRWNADRLWDGYRGYWDAPIFYPTRGALALSEPQPLTGMVFALLNQLTGNVVLAYNMLLLLILAANGLAAADWLRQLDLGRGPALSGGLLALTLPFVSNEQGVLQLTVLFPIFLSLSALGVLAQRSATRPAICLGLWVAITFLTCSYYGLFLTLFLMLGLGVWGQRQHLTWRMAGRLGLSALITAALLLPVIPAQLRLTHGYSHTTAVITQNSAQPLDYLRLGARAWGQTTLPWLQTGGGSGQRLYPGTGLLFLAALGLATGWRKDRRRWLFYCALGAGLAGGLSLGLNLTPGGWQPYAWLRAYYPGFRQLRSPFRLGVFVQVFLIGLAGFGLGRVGEWRGRLGSMLAVVLVGLSILEVIAWPARLAAVPLPTCQAAWVDWLSAQPGGAVAVLPFPHNGRVSTYLPTVVAMLQGLAHGHPLVNGYSGFFPPSYDRLAAALHAFPTGRTLESLSQAGVVYVVVDRQWLIANLPADALWLSDSMQLVFGDATVFVYRFKATQMCAPAYC